MASFYDHLIAFSEAACAIEETIVLSKSKKKKHRMRFIKVSNQTCVYTFFFTFILYRMFSQCVGTTY